jgi:hypothetical protein
MRKLLLTLALAVGVVLVPTAAASPTIRLAIIHAVQGCHVWGTADATPLGPTRTLVVKPGTRIAIRVSCPMDFDVVQLAGPKLALGAPRWHTGTAHTLAFLKKGLYRLKATNVQTSVEQGLETLGPDNTLLLTVRVR